MAVLEPESTDSLHPTITEEALDLIMASDGEAPGLYDPPPHIAARIYRNSANRRKSSAASSRRNSMSSHQSGRSARSAHGGPQSTHVAQHLRRASIIQSRKDKAADRNAHAEKVRLRAAMAKAVPRVTPTSEERAIAAQEARERFLAQVKANCAKEVKRSKRVAEEQREKRAAEHLKLKEDMEEKQAEVEKRKAVLDRKLRRNKAITLPTVDEKKATAYVWKPRSDAEAVVIIQRAWKARQRRLVALRFLRFGLTVEAVRKLTFEAVGALLARENVLQCTAKMLELYGLKDESDDETVEKAAVRTFLSVFLILGHPAQVLSKEGEQEQDLANKARELLVQFNRALEADSLTQSTSAIQLSELGEAYASFQAAFTAWKSHDSSYLMSNMLAQFVELDAIWQSVKNDKDGAVAADYKEGIQQNQTLVLVRLKRLAGPDKAMKMIKDAIRASRKARSKKKTIPDSKPRATVVEQGLNVAPPDVALTGAKPSAYTQAESAHLKATIESLTKLPDNRVMIHELAINKDYKIDVQKSIDMRGNVISNVRSNLQQSLDYAGAADTIPALAEMIQNMLLRLLTPGNSLHVLISETLAPDVISGQVKNGTFSYDDFFSFMNTILPKLCAPVRDGEVKDLAEKPSQDAVEQLARIYFVIHLLTLDHQNFILQMWAPKLLEEAVRYESREFEKQLAGQYPTKTLKWWEAAMTKAKDEPPRRSTGGAHGEVSQPTPSRIYMLGMTDISIGVTPLFDLDVPETLELDSQRLNRIRSSILRTITTASTLLTAKNLLRRDVRSLWKNESQRMWELPFSSPPSAFVSIVESRYALPPTTKVQLTSTITRLLNDAREGQINHPVMKVLLKKIHGHVLSRLAASSSEERIRTSTTATEVLGSSGMPEFVGKIGDIVQELSRVADVDREAHGKWYDEVAKKAEENAVETS